MAKITFFRSYNIQSMFTLGDWSAATISATTTSVTFTLGADKITLSGNFTLSGTLPTGGTITSLTHASGTTLLDNFTVTGLALTWDTFQNAIADADLGTVIGNGNDWLIGTSSGDKLYGYSGNDLMQGGSGDDTIYGSYGNDTLNGGTGNDSLQGGSGNDTYVVDSSADNIVELADAGTDTIQTTLDMYTLGNNLENLSHISTTAFTGTGNTLNNIITGNVGADKLSGLGGNDSIRGGNGNDIIDGGNGNDFLVGDSGASYVTTSASGSSPTNPNLPISVSLTMPEIVAPVTIGTPSATISGFINNATLGSNQFNLAFVLDVSGSMASSFTGSNIGDINHDGNANEKVDAAIASFQALVNSLKAAGLSDSVRISLIPFSDSAEIRAIGTATSDANGNGVADVIDAALELDDLGGTNYGQGLNKAIDFFNSSPKGDNFVFFISDGEPGDTYASQVNTLRDNTGINATIRSLGIEAGGSSYYSVLDLLDDGLANNSAIDVKTPSNLTAGLLSSQVNLSDIKELDIYKNGVLVTTLTPEQLTQTPFGLKYSATISDLSTTGSDTIEAKLVLNDASSSFISTSQQVSVGTLLSNDSLVGGAGNDTLDGGAGTDTLAGGLGNDVYHIQYTGKTIQELSGQGNDTVESTITYSLNTTALTYVENLNLLGSGNLWGTGNAGNNRIEGNIGNNVLNGMGGSDTLIGGYGNDSASYANSTMAVNANLATGIVTATGKSDSLSGIECIWGSAYADTLTGDAKDNSFRGNGGNDSISGGSGLDTLDYSTATSAITANLNTSYNYTYNAYGTVSSGNGAEGIDAIDYDVEGVKGSVYSDVITDNGYYTVNNLFDGGAGNDKLNGGSGNDTLIGGSGNDQLNGGVGNDIVDYSHATVGIHGSLADNLTITVGSGTTDVDTLTGIEGVIGTVYADSITGGANNDWINGGAGNDTLNGGAGNDTLIGGAGVDRLAGNLGDDVFYLDSLSDVVVEASNGGTDTIYLDIASGTGSKALGEVENTLLIGGASLNITGGAVANNIVAGSGNDTINGGAGADTLDGGSGVDWLSYAGSVAVTGTLNTYGASLGGDTTSNFENVIGSSNGDNITGDYYDNFIKGGAGNDSLYGGSGNDTLDGGTGIDLLNGGYGTDTVSYAQLSTAISIDLAMGIVTNTAEGNDTLVDIESIIGTKAGDTIVWQGTTSSYTSLRLDGGAGNDSIVGGYEADTLVGGAGNDTLDGGTIGGYVDTVDYSFATTAVVANLATGLATGGGGSDTLRNIEAIIGGAAGDTLTGKNTQSDYFTGGAGADILNGGIDSYVDYFTYTGLSDSSGSAYDTIKNFVSSGYNVDRIDLSAIDANTVDAYTSSSFSFIGTSAFSGSAGELRYAQTVTDTFVYADVNGDKVNDMTIKLIGLHDLTTSNFSL